MAGLPGHWAISEGTRRLHVYSLGLLRQARIRRILELAGWSVTAGWPGPGGTVGVWGQKPVAGRGRWVAKRAGADLITIEDGFLRSVAPGRSGEPPVSLVIDDLGIYYDASRPSRLEHLIESDAGAAETARAARGRALLATLGLSKYNSAPTGAVPDTLPQRFVLVIDQTRGDASIRGAGATPDTFARMLAAARAEHPHADIVVKRHPEVTLGTRAGVLAVDPGTRLLDQPVDPWRLLARADAVYTVSSQLGYEAVLAERPVRCFGQAFYAGWGLTEDEFPVPRRTARPDRDALFAATHLLYPVYYDPFRDRLTGFETAAHQLACRARAAEPEPGCSGEVFAGVRLWKRRYMAAFRPAYANPPRFVPAPVATPVDRVQWVWGGGGPGGAVEDGFLRSVGLGAQLTEPLSLVFDRTGIYFDPSRPSDLETLIAGPCPGPDALDRAAGLRAAIVAAGLSKYNIGRTWRPAGGAHGRKVILVPGQVEDDASIRRGGGSIRTNLSLLEAARAACPDAWLVYKPHPDVEAGLRAGAVEPRALETLADDVAEDASAAEVLAEVDAVWTMTSLIGFEALMRGRAVTCLGVPFYAGWGLTEDLGPVPARRTARPGLDHLVWAALIAYPRYRDSVTGLACPPEVIVERLAEGQAGRRAGTLSKLQGLFAAQSWLWRGQA